MVRDARRALLTMRVRDLILRSPPQAGVSNEAIEMKVAK
jgi:hypothetical protein